MRAVAIDAATRRAGVALWEDGAIVALESSEDWSKHAERLTGLVDRCFAKAGWVPGSVDVCVGGVGPGSFTGARVGLATAKGIALALGRPLVGVISLDAMASAAVGLSPPPARIVALLDAGRGEIFAGVYTASGDRKEGPVLAPPSEIQRLVAIEEAGKTLIVGEAAGLAHVEAQLSGADVQVLRSWATDLPDPGAVARLGVNRMLVARGAGTGLDELTDLEPFYVRAPDITTPKAS